MKKPIAFAFLALMLGLEAQAGNPIRIALTFDDGPSSEESGFLNGPDGTTPTTTVLDVLKEAKISAASFVLTGPDTFLGIRHPKAESPAGWLLLRRQIRENHLLACHWGGSYVAQQRLHTRRISMPAYDSDGDGKIDQVTEPGNALESDLLQCMAVVKQAYTVEGKSAEKAEFVRPPLWKYNEGGQDARPTYKALGLKMILTDAKLFDGGYPGAGVAMRRWMLKDLVKAIDAGTTDVILTMHDSNPMTAGSLKKILASIRKQMKKQGLKEGADWRFVSNPKEMAEILHSREF